MSSPDLDPTGAQTPEVFMQLLRQASAASGLSIADIARRARQRGYELDPDSLARTLEQPVLPSWQTVTGVLTACGLAGMQIDRWMRVYHDLANPAEPIVPVAAPAAPVVEPVELAPISVPPLVLGSAGAEPRRIGPVHYALGAALLVVLIMVPLLLFGVFRGEPDPVAAEPTNAGPRTSAAVPAMPSPTDVPIVQPSPTEVAEPATPSPVPPTSRPPARTTAPPPPPATSGPPPSPADPGVYRSGTASLGYDQSFDLDGGNVDISRWKGDNTLVRMNDAGLELMLTGQPTKQICQSVRDFAWEYRVNNLQTGQWLCVRTADGRYGKLNITETGGSLKVAYTIWN